jgi:signal transduction histidine kinase
MYTKSQQNDMPTYRKYYILYGFAFIVAVIATLLIYSVLDSLYTKTKNIITNESKSNLLTLAQTQAIRFQVTDIDNVSTTTDIGSESYTRLVSGLADIKKNAPKIAFAYIMKYNPDAVYPYTQIADADSADPFANTDDRTDNDIDINKDGKIDPYGADELAPPGLVYKDAPAEDIIQAHEKAHVNEDFYTDTWGTFMSAYVPIKREDGTLAGIFALDMRDDDVKAFENIVYKPFFITILTMIVSILVLGFSLVYVWQKKLKQVLNFDRQKNIVIGMIGHELKTPLSAIRWILASVLEEKTIPTPISKKIQQAYDVTVSASEMSNTILDLSRIQLGKLTLTKENIDLIALLSTIELEMSPIAQSKGVDLTFNNCTKDDCSILDPYVQASMQYIKIAIKNLLSNAIKYTKSGGKVSILLTSPDQKTFHIKVIDTGIGIEEEYHEQMFQKFSRSKDVSDIEGHGLGLYLTNNIVLLHGGRLYFTSVVGKGTEFTMEIPKN